MKFTFKLKVGRLKKMARLLLLQIAAVFLCSIVNTSSTLAAEWCHGAHLSQSLDQSLDNFRRQIALSPDLTLIQEILSSDKALRFIKEQGAWLLIKNPSLIDKFSHDVFKKMAGNRLSLRQIINIKDPVIRNQVAARFTQEQILSVGLNAIIKNLPASEKVSARQKIKNVTYKLFHSRLFDAVHWLCFNPREIGGFRIPQALIEKVIADGWQAHSQEINSYFEKVPRRDMYNKFRKTLGIVTFGLFISMGPGPNSTDAFIAEFNKSYEETIATRQQENVDQKIKSLTKTQAEINRQIFSIQSDIFIETLEQIVQTTHRKPQASEVQYVYAKAFGDTHRALSKDETALLISMMEQKDKNSMSKFILEINNQRSNP